MDTVKKLILYRLTTAFLTAILAVHVGGCSPCEAQEMQHRDDTQKNLGTALNNVAALLPSDIETGCESPFPPAEYRRDDLAKKYSQDPDMRTVRVGIYQNPPKIFIDEKGLPAGIFVDLLDEIAREENWNLVYVPCKWSDCLLNLEEHRIDLMPDVAYSSERDKTYDFHETPVVDSWSQVYANASTRVSTLSDLDGRRIAVLKKGIQEKIFEQMINGFGFTVTFVEAETYEEAFFLAHHGYADAVLSNHFIGDYLYQRYELTKTPVVLNPSSLFYATAQGLNPELLDAIDRHLDEWKNQPNSFYYRTLLSWSEKPPEPSIPHYIILIIAIAGGFLALSTGIILLLRRQVRTKTKHLVEANESIRESEETYRLLVENLNDVIFNLDARGHVTYMSPVVEGIFVFSTQELIGKQFSEYVHAEDLPGLMVSLEETTDGVLNPYEFRVVNKGGSIHHVRTSSRPIEKDGRLVGITGVLTDITERKKMEEQLLQAEKLSSLGGILSGVAHELNNPLTTIIGNAQLLSRMDISSEINKKLDTIYKESFRCTKIVGGLLAFAREHRPERIMTDINEIIMEAYKLREYELRVDNVLLRTELDETIPKISVDPHQIQQVLINLINNAYHALQEKGGGGSILIKSWQDEDDIIIECIDDGPGIPDELKRKIFDPFFTTKEPGKGTGLGLSICYGIIKEHEGFIEVESRPGSGTRFIVSLPTYLDVTAVNKRDPSTAIPRPDETVTVLVIEDEASLRRFISDALGENGYTVVSSESADHAVEILKDEQFDVIVSDMKMPGMSGQNFYTYIKKYYPHLARKIIFITGDVLGKETQDFFKISGCQYVEKPFGIDDLMVVMGELLKNEIKMH
jgi:PAS domain S-box-containing protein